MIAALGSIVALAGLFMAFTWVRLPRGCSEDCENCLGVCERTRTQNRTPETDLY